MNKKSILDYLIKNNRDEISESVRLRLIQTNEHYIYRKVYMKYLIMQIRSKISFMALTKRMTIVELFASTIQRCFYELQQKGYFPTTSVEQRRKDEEIMKCLKSGQIEGFMRSLIMYNISNLKSELDDHACLIFKRVEKRAKKREQFYYIIRNGKEIKCKVDEENQKKKIQTVNLMLKKNFNEMFDNTQQKKQKERDIVCDDSAIKLKKALQDQLTRNQKTMIIQKFRMILGVKSFKGILFVEILLQKYQLLKELFLFEIEDGHETFIPKDLS